MEFQKRSRDKPKNRKVDQSIKGGILKQQKKERTGEPPESE